MDVDRSFFPGFALLDNEPMRVNLVPPQVDDVSDPEAKVNAGTNQQGGVVVAVGHQALDHRISVRSSDGEA